MGSHDEALAYGRIDEVTRTTLVKLWPLIEPELPAVLDVLYGHMAQWPALSSLFANPERMASARQRQQTHWQRLFAATFDADYIASVQRVATTHAKIGLRPDIYMSSYLVALEELHAVALNRLLGTISSKASRAEAVQAIRAIDRGVMFDLTQVITAYLAEVEKDYHRRLEELAGQFQEVVGKFRTRVASRAEALQSDARQLLDSAGISMQQAESVASCAQTSTAEMQTIASAAEQFTASISEITRQIRQAASITAETVGTVGQASGIVQTLRGAAAKIGDVVTLIQAIAGQTNLLALNATIEAARAGQAGRGFAVVAGEVKSLSGQTAQATSDIRGHVEAVRTVVGEIGAAMQGIAASVEQVQEVTTAISAAVEEQSAVTQEISRSVGCAAGGVTGINDSARHAQQIATDSASRASHLNAAAEGLQSDVADLYADAESFIDKIRHADRRKEPREPVLLKVQLQAGGVSLDGMLENISRGGASVRVDAARLPAALQEIRLVLPQAGASLQAQLVDRAANRVNLRFADGEAAEAVMRRLTLRQAA